jgi:hypothetical protein
MKVKSLDEIVSRYAESALISAVRLRRYWISQGLSEDEAIERALKQALGMLQVSGLGPDKLLELFYELQGACAAFIKVLEEISANSKKSR